MKWRDYHEKLLQTQETLLRQQEGLIHNSEPTRAGTGLHMADAGSDSFDQDLALGILSSDRETLYQIQEALGRIRKGTYGICEITGKAISPKRLEAIPWARFSAEAERELEREGIHKRARLANLGDAALPHEDESIEMDEVE